MDKKIGIIGAGRLGSSLAKACRDSGLNLAGISCRELAESQPLAQALSTRAFADNHLLAQACEIIFLTVPDRLICETAETLLGKGLRQGTMILHCSGAMSGFALPASSGILRGSFHPLQSFAGEKESWQNIYIAIDGDEQVMQSSTELCCKLGAIPLQIPPEDRPLYHAAAVFASNYLLTVLSAAEQLFANWTEDEAKARAAILPLVNGTVANFGKLGARKALTGPIVRGDSETIKKHLQALPAEYAEFYKNTALETILLAVKTGSLTEAKISEMQSILKGG